MGLGKTLECLALISVHPHPSIPGNFETNNNLNKKVRFEISLKIHFLRILYFVHVCNLRKRRHTEIMSNVTAAITGFTKSVANTSQKKNTIAIDVWTGSTPKLR